MRVDRWFASPIEEVWRYLTEAVPLDRWLVHGRVDPTPGGQVEMTVAVEPGNAFQGVVCAAVPPTLLEHTLGGEDSLVRWELHGHDGGTRMELRQTGVGDMAWPAAGWHVLLDALEAALAGHERVWTWDELAEHRAALDGAENLDVIDAAITIACPRQQVFAALLTPAVVEQWLPSTAQIEPHVGGIYDLGWSGPRPIRIVELESDRLLAYSWTTGHPPDTVVRWRFADVAGGTRVRLAHRGWDDGGGWREALENLQKTAERP